MLPRGTPKSTSDIHGFEWLLAPMNVATFLNDHWEGKPLHIARNDASYYDDLASGLDAMDAVFWIHDQVLRF